MQRALPLEDALGDRHLGCQQGGGGANWHGRGGQLLALVHGGGLCRAEDGPLGGGGEVDEVVLHLVACLAVGLQKSMEGVKVGWKE